jgi:hypothetical protein
VTPEIKGSMLTIAPHTVAIEVVVIHVILPHYFKLLTPTALEQLEKDLRWVMRQCLERYMLLIKRLE